MNQQTKTRLTWASYILVLVGGLNWGLIGLGGFMGDHWNIINQVLGGMPQVEWLVYILIGFAAAYLAAMHKPSH